MMIDSDNERSLDAVESLPDEEGTIRLTWRDRLVEFGLDMGVAMACMFLAALVFAGILIATINVAEESAPGLFERGSIAVVGLVIVSAAVGNACGYLCFPYLTRFIFRGFELQDDRLDRSVRKLLAVTGMDITAETLYAMKGRTANAMVSGLFRKGRYIFFTDKLLEKMKEDEILAIFAHEVAHIRHRHLFKMLLSGILWICVIQIIGYLMDFSAYFDALDESHKTWASGLIGGVNVWLVMVCVMFPLSRRNEYEADATAAGWVGVECYSRALYRLHQLNDRMKTPRKFARIFLTHPTLQNRLDRVAQLNSK
ncbi:MAG: M56 family metallopeptidase [Gemmatimonadetes bacterium]|nr:M56 family metallopeptidase [Gemmatimonadota bacterium]MYG84239.1 M56 family metallopeptidase [Gemmatimonadota bacterium]MYJ89873.1 M56 family metallopeptidase [Gemmatimonadota bacterium]